MFLVMKSLEELTSFFGILDSWAWVGGRRGTLVSLEPYPSITMVLSEGVRRLKDFFLEGEFSVCER